MYYYLDLSSISIFFYSLLVVALWGVLVALDHFVVALLFLDLLLLINILLLLLATHLTGSGLGYSMALLLLGVAAADTAVGLGLFILYFKTTGTASVR